MGYEFVDEPEDQVGGYEFTDEPEEETGGYEFTDEPEEELGGYEFTDEGESPDGVYTRPPSDSPIPLTSVGEAVAKGELGITETAQKDYEAATGVEAPKNPILAQIANMGLTVGGKLNANLQMQAA